MGQRLQIAWQETAAQLERLYRLEHNTYRQTRLLALWHLRCGKRLQDVVKMLGVCYRTVQNWVSWYRQGGLPEVLRRIPGRRGGSEANLTPIQQRALAAKVARGLFRTVWDAL